MCECRHVGLLMAGVQERHRRRQRVCTPLSVMAAVQRRWEAMKGGGSSRCSKYKTNKGLADLAGRYVRDRVKLGSQKGQKQNNTGSCCTAW